MLLALFNPLLYSLNVLRAVVAAPPVVGKHLLDDTQLANGGVNTVKRLIELNRYLLDRLETIWNWHLIPPLSVRSLCLLYGRRALYVTA